MKRSTGQYSNARSAVLVATAMLLLVALLPLDLRAAPGHTAGAVMNLQATPDWLTPEGAARLDLGFDVLVPTAVPQPFAGEPAMTAEDGFYSLYWMIPGTPPTFLMVTGEVGGEVPDFSKADRNNQLAQNDSVGGVPAWHDLTDLYDLIYWQIGDVLYSVESRNMVGIDSKTLAETLVILSQPEPTADPTPDTVEPTMPADTPQIIVPAEVPAGTIIEISVIGPADSVIDVDRGSFPGVEGRLYYDAGGKTIEWKAPDAKRDVVVTFLLRDLYYWDVLATTEVTVKARAVSEQPVTLTCPAEAASENGAYITVTGEGYLAVAADRGIFPANTLNRAFSPDVGGIEYVGAEMPFWGIATVWWQAPKVKRAAMVTISAVNANNETVATCKIRVVQRADLAPSATAEPGSPVGTGDGTTLDFGVVPTVPAAPTRIPTAQPTADGGTPEVGASPDASPAGPSPTPQPTLTPTPQPTAMPSPTLAPAVTNDGMVSASIGPEGGSLTSPQGVTLAIPAGALRDATSVKIVPIPNLSDFPTIDEIPGTAFGIALSGPDGLEVGLEIPATLSFTVTDQQWSESLVIYDISDGSPRAMPDPSRDSATRSVSVQINHSARFIVGVTSVATGDSRTLEFVGLVVAVVLLVLVVTVLLSFFRRRRPMSVPKVGVRRNARR